MAHDELNEQGGTVSGDIVETIQAIGQDSISLPDVNFIKNAELLRDGQDLILEGPDGSVIIIEDYFNASPAPLLQAPDGETLTPDLIGSFVQTAGPIYLADLGTMNDESPVGAVQEISGRATVTHTNGFTENITIGTPVYPGDIIETSNEGAVNIEFIDETNFAISQNAKLAIDEYIFDPVSESGKSDFSILRGLFVFTSGLIGRDDPDDVEIDTPMGSIGIRGTIIAGNIDTGEITVLEGAIVLRSLNGDEITLSNEFDTGKFDTATGSISYLGTTTPEGFTESYDTLMPVSPNLFSGMGSHNLDASPEEATPDTINVAPATEGATINQEPAPDPNPVIDTTTSFDGTTNSTFGDTSGTTETTVTTSTTDTTTATDTNAASSTTTTATTDTNTVATDTTTQPPPGVLTPPPPPPIGSGFLDLRTISGPDGSVIGGGGNFGLAVSALGDIDNDGKIDFGYLGVNGSNQIVLNTVSSGGFNLTTEALNVIMPPDGRLSSLGDIDGDGFDDVIIGAPQSSSVVANAGDIVIRSSGDPNSNTNFSDDFIGLTGAGINMIDQYGASVAGPGDVNGDGYNDILFTAPQEGASAGQSFLFFGNAGLFAGGNLDPATADLTITGEFTGDLLGSSISTTGDFDGDGLADFIVGAEAADGGKGSAYVIFGQSGAWSIDLTLAPAAGNQYLEIKGTALGTNDKLGHEVFGGLNFNGDSFGDVIVVNENIATGDSQLHMIYGGLGFGTFDVSTQINGVNGFTIDDTGSAMKMVGGGSAGDFNGDGFDDFALVTSDGGAINDIYVIYGGTNIGNRYGSPVININDLENDANLGEVAFKMIWGGFDGETIEISSAGDQDGDGFEDVVVGSALGGSGNGEVILVTGRPRDIDLSGPNPDMHASGINGPANVIASSNNDALVGNAGANDLNDGGFAGISMRGGAGDDGLKVNNASFRNIDGGDGYDTFLMAGGTDLNLAAAGAKNVSGVELFKMINASGETLTLGLDDIFRLMQESTDGTLTIQEDPLGAGTSNFVINDNGAVAGALDATNMGTLGFTDGGVNGGGFQVWGFNSYQLLVDTAIDTATIV